MQFIKTTLSKFLIPPTLNPGWARLRMEIEKTKYQVTLALMAVVIAGTFFLDLNMLDPRYSPVYFYAAIAIRYVVVVVLLCPYLLGKLCSFDSFLVKHMAVIASLEILITFSGVLAITILETYTLPENVPEFSVSRVVVIWVSLVILPVKVSNPFLVVFCCIALYTLCAAFLTTTPLFWVITNIMALAGVSFAGLFASYNREMGEYNFYRNLADGVKMMYPDSTMRPQSLLMEDDLLSNVNGSGYGSGYSHDNDIVAGRPEPPSQIIDQLDSRLREVMSQLSPVPDVDASENEISILSSEVERIKMLIRGFDESIRKRFFGLWREFFDVMTERAFRADFYSGLSRLRSTRISLVLVCIIYVLYGIIEYFILDQNGVEDGVITNLLTLRYAVAVPVLLLIILWITFAKPKLIITFHPFVMSIGLLLVQFVHILRFVEMIDFAKSMPPGLRVGLPQEHSFMNNILRGQALIACGFPIRMVFSVGTGLVSVLGTLPFAATRISGYDFVSLGIIFPLLVLFLGGYKTGIDENKARMTYLLGQLRRRAVQLDRL